MSDAGGDCIFCKIVSGELRMTFIAESPQVVAFRDIAPQAPTHVLIVPRRHIEDAAALTRDDDALQGELFEVARRVAEQEGIEATGYRIVTNVGPDAGQTVLHLHWHLLGGAALGALA